MKTGPLLHPLHERYAALLTEYCVGAQPGERVMLDIATGALPMARALTRAVLERGAEPHLRLTYPEQLKDFLELAPDSLLSAAPLVELEAMRRMDAYIRVGASANSFTLGEELLPRLAQYARRMSQVTEERLTKRWVGSLYPTAAAAQEAGMSSDDYERFVYNSMFLLDADPAAKWRELGARQQSLTERLDRAQRVRIEGPGTELNLSVAGRRWENSDGKRNMPSGEVFTGPVESSAEGVITFEIPSRVDGGVVEGATLTFEGGRVVRATARRGQEILDAKLATDEGARYLGELGVGTNPHITRPTFSTLYDEKILGTVHLALGRSYPATGGVNESAIHWDLICDLREAGRVVVDGEVLLEGGRLLW